MYHSHAVQWNDVPGVFKLAKDPSHICHFSEVRESQIYVDRMAQAFEYKFSTQRILYIYYIYIQTICTNTDGLSSQPDSCSIP
jgi:hypothetical protein